VKRLVVAAALLAACRGEHHDAGKKKPASAVSVVPKLPYSDDGAAELHAIDERIRIHANEPPKEIGLLLERATYLGHVEDYQTALGLAEKLTGEKPDDPMAWRIYVGALSAVHKFKDARAALEKVKELDPLPDDWRGIEVSLDEATGKLGDAAVARSDEATKNPNAITLTQWAANLATRGSTDKAIPLIPKAAEKLRDNQPETLAYLLFQWGRVYELDGKPALAREFYAEAHKRMPGYVEATAHLAQTMMASGDTAGAKTLVEGELAKNRHPTLLALAVQLGHSELLDETKRAWDRYVDALPEAFCDHAARFYLTIDPARALALARANLANRDTPEARALVTEAALAAGDAKAACEAADPLATEPAPRAQKFVAWKALSKCGRTEEAQRLARDLGIAQ
jgi:tetratricopeptide (TPR) repeat protein